MNAEVQVIKNLKSELLDIGWRSNKEVVVDGLTDHEFEVKFGPGTIGESQALDRIAVLSNQIEDLLLFHPTIANSRELSRLIMIGQKYIDKAKECLAEEIEKGRQSFRKR